MKKLLSAMLAIVVVALSSCSSNEPKEISPTSAEFISGELAKLIEVVEEPCQLTYVEKEGEIGTQYIKLKVKLRLTKESPELQNMDARDINFVSLLSVATVNLVDASDTKVQDLDVKSEDLLKLKKLLQGKKGDEATITFEGEFHNSKDAPKWFEETTAFTPYLTADVKAGDTESVEEVSASYSDGAAYQAAVINDADGWTNVRTQPNMNGTVVTKIYDGEQFYFEKVPGINWVKVYRTADAAAQCIGYMHSSRVRPVSGSVASATNGDVSFDNDEYDSGDSEGDGSIDRFLDEYERFYDRYIKVIKKLDKDDPTFAIEYAKMMNSYQKLTERERQLKSNMSTSQLNRLNQIHAKLMQEMQQFQ